MLAAAALPAPAGAATGDSGSTVPWVWVIGALALVIAVTAAAGVWLSRKGARPSMSDIADGRRLLIARGRRVTEELTTLGETVAERDDEGLERQHERALEIVAGVRARISRVSGQRVQARAHLELDEAEWLVGGIRARLDGFVDPVQPSAGVPATCFFDGDHGLATVEVDLGGIAYQRVPVRACAACAVGLVRGEHPEIGSVELGGRTLPWPAVPRWCGSYGWDEKVLRHLHYDGEPLFGAPEGGAVQQPRVARERGGAPDDVLPETPEAETAGPEVLPEPAAVLPEEPALPPVAQPAASPAVDASEVLPPEPEPELRYIERRRAPVASSAFAALEGDPVTGERRRADDAEPRPE